MVGHSMSVWRARGLSTADAPFARPDGRRWGALRQPGRVPLRGPREGLRVNVLPDLRHFAISNGNVEDPIVLERLMGGFDFPRSNADDQNPVSCATNSGGVGYVVSISSDAF